MTDKSSIITLPAARLRTRSKRVGVIDDSITEIIRHMEAATLDWEDSRQHEVGVALAAVQIDIPLRIVIIRHDFDNKKDRTFTALINPVITKYEGEIEEDYEGCLSITDIYGKVPRHTKVLAKALNLQGQEIRISAEGFLARVLQHEIDHTNGIVFVDHIKTKQDAFFRLQPDGKLGPVGYEAEIKHNPALWPSDPS